MICDVDIRFGEIIKVLQKANIPVDRLFIDADLGFDAENLQKKYR